MTRQNTTPPATREYCVYATQVVCQRVEASSAEEAYRTATERPHDFEPCGPDLTFDRAVKDVASDEFIRVGRAPSLCTWCGSEIVPSINDSHFAEGECGPCEYRRYHSQPGLVRACGAPTGLVGRDRAGRERVDLGRYRRAERACRYAFSNAHGTPA
jgi:hypothetical protein